MLLNLGIHQFSYRERLIHSKRHLKRSFCVEFKENLLSYFLMRESLPKSKILLGLPSMFLYEATILSEKTSKWELFYLFEENHSDRFFEIRTSEI